MTFLVPLENLCERQCAVPSQSSTYSNNAASLANDGVIITKEEYCAITDHGLVKAWLQVDLGRQFSLKSIKIYPRREGDDTFFSAKCYSRCLDKLR